MEPTDITVEILRDIRDETRKTNEEIRRTNERVDALRDDTNTRLDALRSEVNKRQTETEIRLATEIVAEAGAVREVRDVLRQDLALRARVDDHERRITAIEQQRG